MKNELAPRPNRQNTVKRAADAWSVGCGAVLGAGILLAMTAITVWDRKIADHEMVRKQKASVLRK